MLAKVTLALLALLSGSAQGFVQQPAQTRISTTSIQAAGLPSFTGYDSFERLKTLTNVPSGEEQRKLRRTVYTHDDWKRHRNQDRFIVYLAAIFKSGVYKNLANEVILATGIAAFVVVYNAIVGDYTDFSGVKHAGLVQSNLFPKIGLPLTAFTLTSPSLGLLLGKTQKILQNAITCRSHLTYCYSLSSYSLPNQHFLPTLGRSTKELGV